MPGEWKLDMEVVIKHNDLYAWAWGCENKKPVFFDGNKDRPNIPNSPKMTETSDLANNETSTFTGTIREYSLKISPGQKDYETEIMRIITWNLMGSPTA